MQTWVFRANATRLDDDPREFNVLAKGADESAALAFATAEMNARGWLKIEVLRSLEMDPKTSASATGYLRNAIENVEEFGFSFIRYGARDN